MIQSPFAWIGDQLDRAFHQIGSANDEQYWHQDRRPGALAIRRLGLADVGEALTKGLADFATNRTDVIFLCVIYPLVGLVLGRLASGYDVVPLLFPLASGFALVGPFAAVGLNEMSRRRELGMEVSWVDAFGVVRSPSIGPIIGLGLLLIAIFLLWLVTAEAIYVVTLGPDRRRLSVRGRHPFNQRRLLPVAARPRRQHGDSDLDVDPGRGRESYPDGRVGPDRRRRPGDRIGAGAPRTSAGARAYHLAPISPRRPAGLNAALHVGAMSSRLKVFVHHADCQLASQTAALCAPGGSVDFHREHPRNI